MLNEDEDRQVEELVKRLRANLRKGIEQGGGVPAALAARLGVARTTVSRKLSSENLTLRSIAELAWAAGAELHFVFQFPGSGSDSEAKSEFGRDKVEQFIATSSPQKQSKWRR